jgi:putative hydrolase of the HAD superfamily
MRYNVILFDADGTLFDFHAAEKVAFKAVLEKLGLKDDFDNQIKLYEPINDHIWSELEKGLISQEALKVERFNRYLKKINLDYDPTVLADVFMTTLANTSILYDGVEKHIASLSKKYKLIIVTNGLKEVQVTRVRHSVLNPYVLHTVISDEINIQKPDPRIIDHALNLIHHTHKDDVIIVGDRLQSDILAGFNAGIDTMWFNPESKPNTLDQSPTYTVKTLEELFNTLK